MNGRAELQRMKEKLWETYNDYSKSDEIFYLTKLQNVDNELKEVLILIYSGYTTHIQSIRKHHFEHLSNMIDIQIQILDSAKPKTNLQVIFENVKQVSIIAVTGVAVFYAIWVLYHYDMNATKSMFDGLKSIISAFKVL